MISLSFLLFIWFASCDQRHCSENKSGDCVENIEKPKPGPGLNITDLDPVVIFPFSQPSGGFYHLLQNRIIYVEGNGQLSTYDFIAKPKILDGEHSNPAINLAINAPSLNLFTPGGSFPGHIIIDSTLTASPALRAINGLYKFINLGVFDQATFETDINSEFLQTIKFEEDFILFSSLQVNTIIAFERIREGASLLNFDYGIIYIQAKFGTTITFESRIYDLNDKKQILATDWIDPVDVIPTSDYSYYYISEFSTGRIYKTPANTPSQSAGSWLFTAVHPFQLALDPITQKLYVIEGGTNGRLWVYSGGIASVVTSGFQDARGIVGDSTITAWKKLYISQLDGKILVLDLETLIKTELLTGLTGPKFLSRHFSSDSYLYVTETTKLTQIDLSTNPITTSLIADHLDRPTKAIPITSTQLAVTLRRSFILDPPPPTIYGPIYIIPLDNLLFGPLLMGIGLVPISEISDTTGLATVLGSGYPLNCLDAPFGGIITILINHDLARSLGYTHYVLSLAGNIQHGSYGDYKWDSILNRFIWTMTHPELNKFYPVRKFNEIFLNHYWGGTINTVTDGTNGILNRLSVTFYKKSGSLYQIQGLPKTKDIKLDNNYPLAKIDNIYHSIGGSSLDEIDACDIVTGSSSLFTFDITASDPEQHLHSYTLSSSWGINKNKLIFSDKYENHLGTWLGLTSSTLPNTYNVPPLPNPAWDANVDGDRTSRRCAHTFYLEVWDRTINGLGRIHRQSYSISVTFMLDPLP